MTCTRANHHMLQHISKWQLEKLIHILAWLHCSSCSFQSHASGLYWSTQEMSGRDRRYSAKSSDFASSTRFWTLHAVSMRGFAILATISSTSNDERAARRAYRSCRNDLFRRCKKSAETV